MNGRDLTLALFATIGVVSGCHATPQARPEAPVAENSPSIGIRDATDSAVELLGVYTRTGKYYGETLELKFASRFDYSDWSCVGNGAATGMWRLLGDSVEVTRVDGNGGVFLNLTDDGDVSEINVVLLRIARSEDSIELVHSGRDQPTPDELRELNEYQAWLGLPPVAPGWNYLRRSAIVSTGWSDGAKVR